MGWNELESCVDPVRQRPPQSPLSFPHLRNAIARRSRHLFFIAIGALAVAPVLVVVQQHDLCFRRRCVVRVYTYARHLKRQCFGNRQRCLIQIHTCRPGCLPLVTPLALLHRIQYADTTSPTAQEKICSSNSFHSSRVPFFTPWSWPSSSLPVSVIG